MHSYIADLKVTLMRTPIKRNPSKYFTTFLFLFVASIGLAQEDFKKDTILSIVRAYCLDNSQTDTLLIKEGMETDLATVYSFVEIVKMDSTVFIQSSNQEVHLEDGKPVRQHIVDFNHILPKDDFLFLVESELLNCRYGKSEVDYRWSYQIVSDTSDNQIFLDVFAYPLFQLIKAIKKPVPFEEYFCTSGLTWIKRTEITEDFRYEKTRYDTIVTEKLICPNGDFGWRTILDTRKKNNWNATYIDMEVTIDSSAYVVNKARLLSNSKTEYQKIKRSRKYSYSVVYNSDWCPEIIHVYQTRRKNKIELTSIIHLDAGDNPLGPRYFDYQSFHFLGIFHRWKGFEEGEFWYVSNQIFGRVMRNYDYSNGKRRLTSKTITKKKKVITKDYTWHGEVESLTIETLFEPNKPKESLKYEEDKLVERITYFYEVETGEAASKRRNDFF